MKITCIISAQNNCFCQSLQLLFITFECVYFDGFLFILFFPPVLNYKYSRIWRQCTTWCFPRPFQSGVTTAVRGALKKCQLAIKVPQTSIMSSSYESPGAAQDWAIMSTVKNGCGRPQHSLFPLIIAQCWCWSHCLCMVESRQLQVYMVKITTAPITLFGEDVHQIPLCAYCMAELLPQGIGTWAICAVLRPLGYSLPALQELATYFLFMSENHVRVTLRRI